MTSHKPITQCTTVLLASIKNTALSDKLTSRVSSRRDGACLTTNSVVIKRIFCRREIDTGWTYRLAVDRVRWISGDEA